MNNLNGSITNTFVVICSNIVILEFDIRDLIHFELSDIYMWQQQSNDLEEKGRKATL